MTLLTPPGFGFSEAFLPSNSLEAEFAGIQDDQIGRPALEVVGALYRDKFTVSQRSVTFTHKDGSRSFEVRDQTRRLTL